MSKEQFEAKCREMIGIVLAQVRYYEIGYEDDGPYWNEDPRFDSLDFGLDLVARDGRVFGIIWDHEFTSYGVTIVDHSLEDFLSQENIINVTHSSRWRELLDQQIVDVRVIWSWGMRTSVDDINRDKVIYPQDLVIRFDSGRQVFISALEISKDHISHMMDHITVFFDENVANTFQVGIDFETS